MAHIPLHPIGSPREACIDDATFEQRRHATQAREAELARRRAAIADGWGPKYVARVHGKGKLTARERLDRLRDPGSPVHEVGTFVNDGRTFGDKGLRSPAAGVVTAFTRIRDRWCMVIANDNTVASGSWWPRTPEKIERAQSMALRLRIPSIYLVDCSGLFLPEQAQSFPGATGAGHIFKMNSLLSAHGVPQLAGVFGDCIAGGGYMPIISDRVYMTEQAYMVIAGAALIKGAKGQQLTSLDIGGPEVHVHQSGCADVRVPDDETLLQCLRDEVGRLPTSAVPYYRGGLDPVEPDHAATELTGLLPSDHREGYDAMELLARLVDASSFWEILPAVGDEIVCGVGRVGGLWTGFVLNRQGLVHDPDDAAVVRPASILYREGIAKISAFSRACNDDGIPMVWLQDISGFDIGTQAEQQGLLGFGSNLIYTNSTNTVPMFTVLLRKASGAGYYAMAGLPYDPVVQLSTVLSRLSVMEGRTLAIATYRTRLDDEFRIVADSDAERETIAAGMRDVEERIERDMDPVAAASQMDTDEVIALGELRGFLTALIEASYQACGTRRVKNPRIWSLHDLHALFPPTAPTSTLTAFSTDEDGRRVLRSPTVGRWRRPPGVGDVVRAGSELGQIQILGVWHNLWVPCGVEGIIESCKTAGPVDHGAPLCVVAPRLDATVTTPSAPTSEARSSTTASFRSPFSGRFYSRPAPDAAAFVQAGDIVERGRVLALLEVMKTFHRITYDDQALPERARIVELCCADETDVDAGAPLFRLEPVGDP